MLATLVRLEGLRSQREVSKWKEKGEGLEGSRVSRQGRPRPAGSGKGRTLKVFISSLHRLTSERKYRGILSPVPSAIYTLASFVWSLSNVSCNVRDRRRQSQRLSGGERLGDFSPALRRLVRGADAARGT